MDKIKKMLPALILGIVLTLAAGVASYQYFVKRTKFNDSFVNGNTAGNLYNYGLFCEYGDTIYFSNPNDNNYLYSMNTLGGEITKLYEDSASFINADEHYVYYIRSNSNSDTRLSSFSLSSNGLCRYDLRTKKVTLLDIDPSMYASLIGNYIYYTHYDTEAASTLYRIKIDGSEKEQIDENPYFTCSANGQFFYYNGISDDHNIYQMDTQTNDSKLICSGNYWMPTADNENIYFLDCEQNYALVKLGLSDSSPKVIISDRIETYNVYGDTIYFQRNNLDGNSAFCSIKTDGTGYTEIRKGDYNNINATSRYIYFSPVGEEGIIYRIPVGGDNTVSIFHP